MQTKHLFLLPAFAFFACAGLQAQVTFGGLTEPAKGALLDLNSPTGNKGGLLLSNVAITDLGSIPAGNDVFPGVSPDSLNINWGLRGALVYNTHPATVPGVYVWSGKRWLPAGETEDQILFTIRTGDGDYAIPTSGILNQTNHDYDWYVTVDGLPTTACPDGNCTGTGNDNGIPLSGLSTDKDHQIRITPHGDEDPGWGNAFGHGSNTNGANTADNKNKLISIDAPLSTLAFAPKTTENTASANWMFAFMFISCSSLTTPAVIRDNYKLPETITDLSYFLVWTHGYNTSLTQPIDLTPLKDWFKGNSTMTDLSGFLGLTHIYNTSLTLSGQIIFPNWLKTIKQGTTPIQNVSDTFFETFAAPTPPQGGDTGEPRFEDGTPLSSLGNPSTSRATYINRTYFTNDASLDYRWK